MRRHKRLWALAGIVASGGLLACVGGAGDIGDGLTSWERAESSYERAANTREPAPPFREGVSSSNEGVRPPGEPAPGGGGGADGAQCVGTFRCGDGDDDVVTFTPLNGGCSASIEGTTLVLTAEGRITAGGQNVGSWESTGSGISVKLGDLEFTCTRRGSGDGPGGGTGGGGGSGDGRGEDDDVVPLPGIPPMPDGGG